MTKVQLEYNLLKPIDDRLMEQIARLHGVYGILRVTLAPSFDRVTVEYDASRLSPLEVENALHSVGLPVALEV